jgi:transposase
MPTIFREVGLNEREVQIGQLLVVGRLVCPGSEMATLEWAKHISGIGELLGSQIKRLSHNSLYRVSDKLYECKERIEESLREGEKGLFGLEERVILYDLTNTYFEGSSYQCSDLEHGKSKDKRNDCPLMSVGLVVDEWGFAKRSEFFGGKVDEPGTLEKMLHELGAAEGATVVVDAGIGTEENLELLKAGGYHYVCVARGKPLEEEPDMEAGAVQIKAEKKNQVRGKLIKNEKEWILLCESEQRRAKEQSMKEGFRRRFEEGLELIRQALDKKGGTKSYEKVLERIGRLKERSHGIHRYYDIEITEKEGIATQIRYSYSRAEEAERRYSGRYYIRTNRTDLAEADLWQLYITLNAVEDSFRSLKSELGLRPVYHWVERRIKGHLFITLLAYHVLNAIRHRLRGAGYRIRWSTLRKRLSTHVISTITMNTDDDKRVSIRSTSKPEVFHRDIYRALGLDNGPLRRRRTELPIGSVP